MGKYNRVLKEYILHMKYLRRFNEERDYDVDTFLNIICNLNSDLTYDINSDGSYDFYGSVYVSNIPRIPITIRSVTRDFICNNKIESLRGFPRYVGRNFSIGSANLITSLEGCPEEVVGNFYCGGTSITDLKGAPRMVGGFDCSRSQNLTSLEGLPKIIGGGLEIPRIGSINFENCPHLIFPADLRDCQLVHDNGNEFRNTPLKVFQQIFESLKTFQESLDYNYFKGTMRIGGEVYPTIDLFKFKEALSEFDIDMGEYNIGDYWLVTIGGKMLPGSHKINQLDRYIFVNEGGRRVDFGGNQI